MTLPQLGQPSKDPASEALGSSKISRSAARDVVVLAFACVACFALGRISTTPGDVQVGFQDVPAGQTALREEGSLSLAQTGSATMPRTSVEVDISGDVALLPEVADLAELAELAEETPEAEKPPVAVMGEATGVAVETLPAVVQPEAAEDTDPSANAFTIGLLRQRVPVNTIGGVTYFKSAYFGTVWVGSPPAPFKVVFDTGSGHLILPSTYCHSETCRAHTRYRRSKSFTAKDIDFDGSTVEPGAPRDQITVSFGTGEVTGVFVEDVVCLPTASKEDATYAEVPKVPTEEGAELPKGCMKLRLIAATEMSKEPFKSFQFDGVLGLGLEGLSQTPEFNFFDVIASAVSSWGSGNPDTFAVFLADSWEEESQITFGGWKPEFLTETLAWNPVLNPEMGHWTIGIKSLSVTAEDGTVETLKICNKGCKAVVDTGTSLLSVPTAAFPELFELLRHPAHRKGHCLGRGPTLNIELDDFTVHLEPRDYSRIEKRRIKPKSRLQDYQLNLTTGHGEPSRRDMFCKPMLMSMDLEEPLGPKLFILGEPVLRKYYTVYDGNKKRVGFGRALHLKTPTAVEDLAEKLGANDLKNDDLKVPKSIVSLFRMRRTLE